MAFLDITQKVTDEFMKCLGGGRRPSDKEHSVG